MDALKQMMEARSSKYHKKVSFVGEQSSSDESEKNLTERATVKGRKAVNPRIEKEKNLTERATVKGRKAVNPRIEKGPSQKKVYLEDEQSSSDDLDRIVELHIESYWAKEAIVTSKKFFDLLEKRQQEEVESTAKYQRLQKECQSLSSINESLKSENARLKLQIAHFLEDRNELARQFGEPQDSSVFRTKRTDDVDDFGSNDDDDDDDDDNKNHDVASLNSAKVPSSLSNTFTKGLETPSSNNSFSSSKSSSTDASGMSYYLRKAGADFTDVEDSLEENKKLTLKILTDVFTVMKSLKEEVNELKKEKKKLQESLQQKTKELEDAKEKATIETLTLRSSLLEEKKKKQLMKMTVDYQEYQLKKFRDQIVENDEELLSFQKKLEEFRQM